MTGEVKPELDKISMGSLLFRHWDRTLALAQKDYRDNQDKLTTFTWAVKMFRGAIPKSFLTSNFKEAEKKLNEQHKKIREKYKKNKKDYDLSEDFDNIQELFSLCINLLADKGVLYNKVSEGSYYEDN